MDRFVISSEDCIILLAIRETSSLREAAKLLNCDAGGLLRKVQRIEVEHGLIEKNQNRWQLTNKGLDLVVWARESILEQKKLLLSESTVRIAATTWFAERVLIPNLRELPRQFKSNRIDFLTPESDFETTLLEGGCDFVIICHPPENPLIAHKRICIEKWSVVASKDLLEKQNSSGKACSIHDLLSKPYIQHRNLNHIELLELDHHLPSVFNASMDSLIGVRSALIHTYGWSFVPTALVKDEINKGVLLKIDYSVKMDRSVCLWWVRNSSTAKTKTSILSSWLDTCCSKI